MRRTLPALLLLLLGTTALAAGCTKHAEERVTFESAAAPSGLVVVEAAAGSVNLEVDPSATRVHGFLDIRAAGFKKTSYARRAVEQTLVVESGTSDELILTIETPGTSGFESVTVDLDLRVPPGVAVSAYAVAGAVRITDLDVLDVDTVDGEVDLRGTAGNTRVRAQASPVIVDGHRGDLDVRTTLADLSLFSIRGNVRGTTTEGFVEARVTPPLGGEVILSTTRNGVDLALPWDFGATLTANTIDGEIYVDGLDFHPAYSEPGLVEGQLFDGGGFVDVRTTLADIRLHRR